MLVSGYLGDGGGAERQITELATGLDPRRYRATVACLIAPNKASQHGGAYYQRLRQAGVEVVDLPRAGRSGLGQLVRLARLVRARRPAVVHSFLFSQNWRARLAVLSLPGVAVISSDRSVDTWKLWIHRAVDRIQSAWTARIVANAGAIRDYLVEVERIAPERIVVIPNGVDTERFRPKEVAARERSRVSRGWDPEALVLAHAGTMEPHKGQRLLLEASAHLSGAVPSLRVVLIGDGKDREALARLAKELRIDDRVAMPGFVRDVADVLGAADVYVHPSREREGCSNAILEAMACGLPVVATDVGGNRELVVDGETGFLVAEDDVDAIVGAVRRLAGDVGLRHAMGDAGRRRVVDRFSVKTMIHATSALYDTVLEISRS